MLFLVVVLLLWNVFDFLHVVWTTVTTIALGRPHLLVLIIIDFFLSSTA